MSPCPSALKRRLACFLAAAFLALTAAAENVGDASVYDVSWGTPGRNSAASTFIGNGEIGLNVWVEDGGDLVFFIGKTDAWDVNLRLLKLGKVRVKLSPSLTEGATYLQTLKLRDGLYEVRTDNLVLRLWVDAHHPVIQIDAESLTGEPLSAEASFEPWRVSERSLGVPRGGGKSEFFSTGYTTFPGISYPDVILPAKTNQIGWYHRNEKSPWMASLKLQKVDQGVDPADDPVLHRTMGAVIRGDGFVAAADKLLKTKNPLSTVSLRVHVLTKITPTATDWLTALEKQADAIDELPTPERLRAHKSWWDAFWRRSWILPIGDKKDGRLPENAQSWQIGQSLGGGNRFGGETSDGRVLAQALSPSQVAALAGEARQGTDALRQEPYGQACTLSIWVKPNAAATGRILDKIPAGTADGVLLDAVTPLSLRWLVGSSQIVVANCLKPGVWQHVAATADVKNGTMALYLDGKPIREQRLDIAASTADLVMRGYTLQRWVNACAGRGNYPIKFNGSLFTVDVKYDADFRDWGGGYWFQNTRLPYWSMPTSGDFDMMRPLFEFYAGLLKRRMLATRNYYQHDGAFFPETMSIWGTYLDHGHLGYGINREGMPDGLTANTHIRLHWTVGPELVFMMLNYYDYCRDEAFLHDTILPFAHQIVTFYDQHYDRDDDGKLKISPAYAMEDIRNCTNPMPEIAGLMANLTRMIDLTKDDQHRAYYKRLLAELPPLPTAKDGNGTPRFAPCEPLQRRRNNTEKPELYNVFPFLLHGVGRPRLDMVKEAWKYAPKSYGGKFVPTGGWCQDPIFQACMGNAEAAKTNLIQRAQMTRPGSRFPAFWVKNFDWMPDQDHGGVYQIALQKMLIQPDFTGQSDKIFLLPAWPREWDCSFKVHAPYQTTLEGVIQDGKLTQLKVTPATRLKDVLVRNGDDFVPYR